jgi:hypothetical protein
MRVLLISILATLSYCSAHPNRNKDIEVVIAIAESYKYDLKSKTYTVFNFNKPNYVIEFHLSDKEIQEITELYYELSLYKIRSIDKETGNSYIKDECTDMPKTFTKLFIKTDTASQEIQIDAACNNFYLSNFREARKVKKFIRFVRRIVDSKSEVRNAPMSDIWYI